MSNLKGIMIEEMRFVSQEIYLWTF